MNLMMCMNGEPEQFPFLAQITELGAGIELGSYGLIGIQSERDWETRFALHQAVRAQFQGVLAVHGPFVGMEYAHIDHLIRDVVHRRLDMTFNVAVKLKASRVVLHSGYKPEIDLFKLQDSWLRGNVEFWQREMHRWANAGIGIVLENDTDKTPDMLVSLVSAVDNPFLGCAWISGTSTCFRSWMGWNGCAGWISGCSTSTCTTMTAAETDTGPSDAARLISNRFMPP
jgi:sugar phosphate isomerase/epimerase